MDKAEVKEMIDLVVEGGRKLIMFWHEKCLEQIRLNTANVRHLQENKFQLIQESKKRYAQYRDDEE